MAGIPKRSSFFSGKLGMFKGKPRRVSRDVATKSAGRVVAKKAGRNGQSRPSPWQSAEIEFGPGLCL